MGAARVWHAPVYDVHPSDQAIRETAELARRAEPEADERGDLARQWYPHETTAAAALMAFDRDLMIKDGVPRGAAEHLALQHAREQANLEAGQ